MSDTNIISPTPPRPAERPGRPARAVADSVQQHIKTAVHRELIKRVDLDKLGDLQEAQALQHQFFVVIQQIIETNALSGATIHAGQLLWVPKCVLNARRT